MPHGYFVARETVGDASDRRLPPAPLARHPDAAAGISGATFASALLARVMVGSILLLAMLLATNLLMLRWLD